MNGPERIAAAFAQSGKRAALMPYLMGGFPDLATSARIGGACQAAGADVLEVGIPFSDPLADGPVIHEAGTSALAGGATVARVLELVATLATGCPLVVMCYSNLVFARGPDTFADALADAGASGLIVPDLPLEEAPAVRDACDRSGVALVPLIAPTTPDDRLAGIGAEARGFLYIVAVTGTTGERAAVSEGLGEVIARAARHTDVPVAVGFGISSPEQALDAARAGADGVIVGSRLVRAAADAARAGEDPATAVGDLVGALAQSLEL